MTTTMVVKVRKVNGSDSDNDVIYYEESSDDEDDFPLEQIKHGLSRSVSDSKKGMNVFSGSAMDIDLPHCKDGSESEKDGKIQVEPLQQKLKQRPVENNIPQDSEMNHWKDSSDDDDDDDDIPLALLQQKLKHSMSSNSIPCDTEMTCCEESSEDEDDNIPLALLQQKLRQRKHENNITFTVHCSQILQTVQEKPVSLLRHGKPATDIEDDDEDDDVPLSHLIHCNFKIFSGHSQQ